MLAFLSQSCAVAVGATVGSLVGVLVPVGEGAAVIVLADGGVGVAVGGTGVGVAAGGTGVGVPIAGIGVAVGGVGLAVGAPHPAKSNTINVNPKPCCSTCWRLIFDSFRCGYSTALRTSWGVPQELYQLGVCFV